MAGWMFETKHRHWLSKLVLVGLVIFLCLSWMQISNEKLGLPFMENYGKNGSDLPGKKLPTHAEPKIAVCLVGGARKFELTGPSLLQNVVNRYPNSDLFLHSPLDQDSFKFSLLKGANSVAMIRIFVPQHLNESTEQAEVLTASNSPNGIQGLLQYFHLVEGCLTMIKAYQKKHQVKYDWIVRTRVDGYWSGPLPRPSVYLKKMYIVPPGSQFGGLNDRLGIGNMNTSEAALARLSSIPLLHSNGYRRLNSETAFRHQLDVRGISFKFKGFPFCILSERKYAWPPTRFGVPVASILSKGALNGAKCRPCTPAATGEAALNITGLLERTWSWILPPLDLKLCDAHANWEEKWETIFDRVAGPEFSKARKIIRNQSLTQCIKDMDLLKQKAVVWDAPESENICRKAFSQSG